MGEFNINNRKGFLFVVTVFLILTYILLSISVWVKSIEASESTYSEFYKESNVELVMEQITDQKVDSASLLVLNRGLLLITDHTVDNPLKTDSKGYADESKVEAVFGQWLVNGTADGNYFVGGVAPDSETNSSMSAWVANLNSSLSAIGVYVDGFRIYDFKMNQTSYDAFDYSFRMDLSIKDKAGTTSVERTYDIKNKLNITGIPDPAIARESNGNITGRRFFFNPDYSSTSDLKPDSIASGNGGAGWFYGYLVNIADAGNVNSSERSRYIIVGNYSEITSYSDYTYFGGYIFNNNLTAAEADSISKPFIIGASGFNASKGGKCPDLLNASATTRTCALFVAAKEIGDSGSDKITPSSGIAVYDIENLRDFTLCGYYMKNSKAPSFVQRLFSDSYSMYDAKYGIETFLIGNYTLSLGSGSEDKSRLDRDLFASTPVNGIFIRGMPGCRDSSMCSDPDTPTGRFGLSTTAISDYGLSGISCGNTNLAGCD